MNDQAIESNRAARCQVERRARVGQELRRRGIDAAYVSHLVNVRYLTGFTGSNGAVLVYADGSAVFATDGRYRDQAKAELPDVEHVIGRDLPGALLGLDGGGADGGGLARGGVSGGGVSGGGVVDSGLIGLETHVLSVDAHRKIAARAPDLELCSLDRLIEALRVVKDAAEIDALRRACAISVSALEGLLAGPLRGRTERDIARDLENRMFVLGAEAVGFETILASGPNAAIPHHAPGERVVERGDFVKIDFGARVDGYHADCTRTVVAGTASDWQREVYAAVLEAQTGGLALLTEGAGIASARTEVERLLTDSGWLDHFTTGLGHGVGLEIHEDPFLTASHTGKLASRTALTMEPGIYLPGRGGVRIEDTAVVTKGAPEVLTTTTKDLLELA